jgi:4-aminobutyrate aminotransferase / (S)-3-amino-2-methylpropionate transaminase / 5-aminovalerate transaminase
VAGFQRKYSLSPVAVPRVDTRWRRIVTRIPVPESVPIIERMERFEPSSMQGQPPVLIERAEGCSVFDRWDNMWLDFSSGVLISNSGNANPAVVAALRDALEKPLLSTYVFAHEKRAALAERLVALAPGGQYKAFLLSTGSEATENCIKLAKTWGMQKHDPGKRFFVSFENAFHGRTMGAQLAGGNPKQKTWMGTLDDSFIQVPFPDGYKNEDTRFDLFLETLRGKGLRASQVCGVMSESYQGCGPDFFPEDYAHSLEAWCRENDVLLIMDEVQSGFGRTGAWFAFEHYGITPDLIACGKGISSSLPLSAVIGRSDIMELYPPGSMTSTHSGSPLPVAAALANIEELSRGGYLENARALDPVLRDGLLDLQRRFPRNAGCVHAKGLVAGIQMVRPGTKTPDPQTALAINEACYRKGLLMFAPVGVAGECIKIAPSLGISRDALEEGIAVLSEAMQEILG